MSTDSKHLVILAAGTGGHVMPGLAVAKVMASRGWKISWVGTVAGMERGLVERHGIPFHALDFQGAAVADASVSRDLCATCTGIVHKAVNEAVLRVKESRDDT